jgi:hypothetical protein
VFLAGHGNSLQLCSPDHPQSGGKEMWDIISLHPSPQGIVAVGERGMVWIIKKKEAGASAEPAEKTQPK